MKFIREMNSFRTLKPAWPWNLSKDSFDSDSDLSIHRDEQKLPKQKARNSAKSRLIWGKFFLHFEDKQWTADCWPWSTPIVDVEMNGNGSPNQQPLFDMLHNHVKRYSKLPTTIYTKPPLWPLVLVPAQYLIIFLNSTPRYSDFYISIVNSQ